MLLKTLTVEMLATVAALHKCVDDYEDGYIKKDIPLSFVYAMAEKACCRYLYKLTVEQLKELEVLYWYARAERLPPKGPLEQWIFDEYMKDANRAWIDKKDAVEYISGKRHLQDYLISVIPHLGAQIDNEIIDKLNEIFDLRPKKG